ncbi:LysR family transcriptional regulator [Paraburkholderia sp. RP-4-7]|uniref:LysR family transcriptional regulator n=1 Tax=Paraburkholderia polaris TaxID=2728848 RepID=A0A848I755_9BURK|nr:LysR family transcriptional regulator [Paraburkholderia polaris]NML97082.1 LysR family transcriptional regulator [Paraburkholderia polaris]
MNGLSIHNLVRKVDLFTLKLFLTAIEEGQIGRAAVREHIAPSAATKRIQDLEDLAGLKLLDRSPKGVVPSSAGEVFARHIRMMLANLDDMRREIGEFSEGIRGHVAVCAPRLMITEFLGNEIGDFTRRFPLVNVEVLEDSNANAVRAVAAGDVDLSVFVANNELPCDTLDIVEYRPDRLVAVLPPNHPLSGRSSLALDELLDLDFVAHHTTVITGIQRAALGIGRELHVKYSVNTVESARSLVRAGLGITVQPGCMLSVEDQAQLATVPLAGDWARLSHCIGTLHGRSLTAAAKALIEQLTHHASVLHDTQTADDAEPRPYSAADLDRASTNPLAH